MWQVVIHGLPFSYDTPHLRDMVKGVGHILQCSVSKDPLGRNKGWGTVLFDSADTAQKAIQVRRRVSCCYCPP